MSERKTCEACGCKQPLSKQQLASLREEEKLLTAFEGNKDLVQCMNQLFNFYYPPFGGGFVKGTKVSVVLGALIDSERDFKNYFKSTNELERNVSIKLDSLISAIEFLKEACERGHSEIAVQSGRAAIPLTDVFAMLERRIRDVRQLYVVATRPKYVDRMKPLMANESGENSK